MERVIVKEVKIVDLECHGLIIYVRNPIYNTEGMLCTRQEYFRIFTKKRIYASSTKEAVKKEETKKTEILNKQTETSGKTRGKEGTYGAKGSASRYGENIIVEFSKDGMNAVAQKKENAAFG